MNEIISWLLDIHSPWAIAAGTALAAATCTAPLLLLMHAAGDGKRGHGQKDAGGRKHGKDGKRKRQDRPGGDLNALMGYEFIRRRQAFPSRPETPAGREEGEEEAGTRPEKEKADAGQEQPAGEDRPSGTAQETDRITLRTTGTARTEAEEAAERRRAQAEKERERQLKSNQAFNERMEKERNMKPAVPAPEEQEADLAIIDEEPDEETLESIEYLRLFDGMDESPLWDPMEETAGSRPHRRPDARQLAALAGIRPEAEGHRPWPAPEEMLAMAMAEADIDKEITEREKGLAPSLRESLDSLTAILAPEAGNTGGT